MVRHKRPAYVHVYQDRHGKERIYFNRQGTPKVPLPGPIYSEAFWIAYHRAKAGNAEKLVVGSLKTKSGTMSALIAEYYQSSAFTSKAASTQTTYRNQLEAFRKDHGDGPVREIKTKHIDAILGQIAKTSTAQAQKLKKRLTTLFRLAVKWEYRDDNPMLNAERIKHTSSGYAPWSEADIAKYRAFWPDGAPQRIAFEILLFTGLRRSDAVSLGRQHIHCDRIEINAKKTGAALSIPIHPDFRVVLDTIKHDHLVLIATVYGAARSEKAFTNWIVEAARAAGLPSQRSPHGLRKAACRRLAEAGCSASEIMAITGHQNLAEVDTYIRDVNRKQMADSAIAKTYGAG